MKVELLHTLRRLRGSVFAWGGGLGLYAVVILPAYKIIVENAERMVEMLKSYPPEFSALFGDLSLIDTPVGFLNTYFFSMMPLFLGFFVLGAGTSLLAKDEEDGTLDLILAHPIARTTLWGARVLALGVALVGVHLLLWVGQLIGDASSVLDLSPWQHALPHFALLPLTLVYAGAAVLLSQLLPARRLASVGTGAVVVGGYLLTSLGRLDARLEGVAKLSPSSWFDAARAVGDFDFPAAIGLLVVAALLFAGSWWRFSRRDIRVGGEGAVKLRDVWARARATRGASR